MDKYREEFEKLAVSNCADHKRWLKYNVQWNGHTYAPVNYKDQFHCQHAAYFGFAFLIYEQQQKRIDDLQAMVNGYKKLTISIRNEFDLWSDDSEFADVIEAQIENLEALKGGKK